MIDTLYFHLFRKIYSNENQSIIFDKITFQAAIPFDDENRRLRLKRDITCAVGGNRVCNGTCMLRGWKEGACHWDTETGAFDCVCSPVRRGVR